MAGGKYRLYGRSNAGSLAPQIILEEIGAAYELIWIGTTPADLEALRRINPAGKVPSLVLPDGTAVAESAAILIHLTDAHPAAGLAPPSGPCARVTTARCSPTGNCGAGATTCAWPILMSPTFRIDAVSTLGGGSTTEGSGM